jgi:hypothetical protein
VAEREIIIALPILYALNAKEQESQAMDYHVHFVKVLGFVNNKK